jgi:oligoendopeptidase F
MIPGLNEATKAYLLDQEMLRAHAYLINIPMRYEFEKAFYTERAGGEVSVSRALRELMTEAQQKMYGDTLLPDGTDPMFWAYKMHFFITGVSFYNFPYVFGYLLSQALFARFKAEGAAFLPRYEAFLMHDRQRHLRGGGETDAGRGSDEARILGHGPEGDGAFAGGL